MWKMFILLHTLLPGEWHGPDPLRHTITVESPYVYQSQEKCELAAAGIGFAVHPEMGEIGANYKCLEVVKPDDDQLVFRDDTLTYR